MKFYWICPGRRRGVHDGREASVGDGAKAALPRSASLLFPDHGKICDVFLICGSDFTRLTIWTDRQRDILCLHIQVTLVIRSLFICGFAYSRSKNWSFFKGRSFNFNLALVFLFAVLLLVVEN
jgi:hypothetical protein